MAEIEYRPEGLESVVNSPYGARRLKNRDGIAFAHTEEGQEVWRATGSILDLHMQAVAYAEANPGHKTVVWENCCGHQGDPFGGKPIKEVR